MISAAIVVFNESHKLKDCLKSIHDFVDEIVIVDLGSTDDLDGLLEQYTKVKKINHKRVLYVEPVRQFSINHCKGDWVLVLDPDERVSSGLAKKLQEISAQKDFEYSAVNIPTKNIFFDKWIAHTNFWPDRHLRFFKKGTVQWGTKIHSYPKVDGEKYDLEASEKYGLEHYGYKTYSEFIKKQKRYAEVEAQNKLSAGESFSIVQLLWMPLREFLARYVKHQGYLDGFNGIFLVLALMYYQIIVQLNMIRYAKNS